MFMAVAASANAVAATPDDVDARLQAFAAKINAQQPGNTDGKITSAVAGHLNITLNMVASRDRSPESDAQGQAEARQLVCGAPAMRNIVDRYGVTFHFVYSAPNWLTPIRATVTPSNCANPAPVPVAASPSGGVSPGSNRSAGMSARTNWQYTRWGMTPAEVIAASNGAAHAGSGVQSALGEGTVDVVGTYDAGGRIFSTAFTFQQGRLASVALWTTDWSQCIPTIKDLQAVYGHPDEYTDGNVVANATWSDRSKNNHIKMRLLSPKYCEVQYSPIASAAASGL